jgi:hypothetical protein
MMSGQDILLAMAGKKTRAKKAAVLAPIREAVKKARTPNLSGVSFASARAAELARDAGLSWPDFVEARCSSCAGFTADDVRQLLEKR